MGQKIYCKFGSNTINGSYGYGCIGDSTVHFVDVTGDGGIGNVGGSSSDDSKSYPTGLAT